MSNSSRAGLTVLLCIATLAHGAWPTLSHATSSREPENPVTTVHGLLQVAYPELFGKHRFMKLSVGQPIDDSWRNLFRVGFEITPFDPEATFNPTLDQHTGKPVAAPPNAALMKGLVWFDDEGNIFKMWADGSDIIHSAQNSYIEKLIESHPEWSDAKAYEELKKAGALYGPADKEQFLRSVHLDRFERVLGRLKIKSVEFNGLSTDHVGSFAGMFWDIEVDAQLPNGIRSKYGLMFEPFGGRLVGIERLGRPKLAPPTK